MTWWWRLVAAATVAMLSACGEDSAGGGGQDGGGGGGGIAVDGVVVTFVDPGPLVLAPGQIADVTVTTAPPAEHVVSFLLLGESLDASLDGDTTQEGVPGAARVAGPTGEATIALQAPSQAASFRLRASVEGGPPAELEVRVSELGTGTVRVLPTYAGARPLERWTAVVVPRARCVELSPASDPDDALVATADGEDPLIVEDVPVGPRLAVIARSERAIWGCADAQLARADATTDVEVVALDRPLQLGTADLAVELGLATEVAALAPILDAAEERLLDAAFPLDADLASLLLDAMAPHLPPEATEAFVAAREEGLDATLAADLAARAVDPRAALAPLLAEDAPALGPTTGRLLSAGGGPDHALLTVDRVLGTDAARVGAPSDHLVTFVANPGDLVSIGGVVFFFPSRLAGALAEDALTAVTPGAAPGDVLAASFDCAAVAAVAGPVGTCDAACLVTACELGLAGRWTVGLDSSAAASDLGALSFAVSATGIVDEEAGLVGFDGEWIGAVSAGVHEVAVEGPASAEPTAPPDDDGAGSDDGSDAPQPRE